MVIGSASTERPSLRKRLAGAFVALAALASLLQASFVWLVSYRHEEQLIDRVALEQIQRSIAMYWLDPALAQPNTPDMRLYVVPDGDHAAQAALPSWLRELPRQAGSYERYPSEGVEYHIAVERDRDTWFYLPYDVREHEMRQHNAEAALALSVLGVGMLALLVSGGLASGLTRDLNRLATAVARGRGAAAGAPVAPPRFEPLAAHTETAQLAAALDAYRDSVESAIGRERAFSAAASHELRTPLMRAGSSLDLLREGPLDARQQAGAVQIRQSLDEMTMLIGALLRTVRGDTRVAATEISLAKLADELAAHLSGEAKARRIDVRLEVPGDLRLRVDRSALWIVLMNLLRNAIRHSAGSSVMLRWHERTLVVEDDGVGIEGGRASDGSQAADVPKATDVPKAADVPKATGSTEAEGERARAAVPEGRDLGLGLTIVERICEAAGWRIAIGPRSGGGTRVELRFEG